MIKGKKFTELRELLGYQTQKQFADASGIAKSTISDIENNKKDISKNIMEFLIKEHSINTNYIFTEVEPVFTIPPTPGERLAYFRHDREISAEVMASQSDITQEEYEAFEKNEKDPPEHLLNKWRSNFNLSPRWVLAGKGPMYTEPEQTKEIKMITIEGEGETSWQQQFPDVFRMLKENQRLKRRLEHVGCSVCKLMHALDEGRQNRVKGYAEALLQEQQQEKAGTDTES